MDTSELPERDKALLQGLSQDDENAFNIIYKTYSMKLYAVALVSLKSEEMAKEVVQEIFISLWVNRKTATIRQSIIGYLLRAVRYKVFNIIDKQVVRDRYKKEYLRSMSIADYATDQAVECDDLKLAIDKEIGALPETTKNIFVLSRFEGLNNNEIAQQSGLSSKAVEYHITKALKTLRLYLRHVMAILVLVKGLFY